MVYKNASQEFFCKECYGDWKEIVPKNEAVVERLDLNPNKYTLSLIGLVNCQVL